MAKKKSFKVTDTKPEKPKEAPVVVVIEGKKEKKPIKICCNCGKEIPLHVTLQKDGRPGDLWCVTCFNGR